MTDEELLEQLKALYGSEDTDAVLSAYLKVAKSKVLNKLYPYSDNLYLPEKYASNVVEIAIYLLNKRGAEGETKHTEGEISREYESSSVPESMLKDVVPYVGVL